jgi:thiol-disulfide isomerase/thioredoxin
MTFTVARLAAIWILGFAAADLCAADLKPWTGGPTPSLELRDLDNRVHRLADYRGKVVLVNFWATWCGPCRDEMPSIQELKRKLAGRPFVVLAVNLDEPESRIRKFLNEVRVDFPVLLDPERKVSKLWDARILPASFVVGQDGRIRYSLVGEINWGHDLIVSRVGELLPRLPFTQGY